MLVMAFFAATRERLKRARTSKKELTAISYTSI
jgi:hypothetical protein